MKKILIMTCVMLAFVAQGLYAQGPEEMGLTSSTTFGNYRITSVNITNARNMASNDFLKSINANKNFADNYYDSPAEKMGNGFLNTATAWVDIPYEMARVSSESNIVAGLTVGLGEGVISGFARGVSGVADMATFGVPPYDKPLMEPDYKADNPQKELKITILAW